MGNIRFQNISQFLLIVSTLKIINNKLLLHIAYILKKYMAYDRSLANQYIELQLV